MCPVVNHIVLYHRASLQQACGSHMLPTHLFIFLYSLTYFCIVGYQAYFALGAPQCGSRLADIMPGLIYAPQDKLQIGNVREIALSSPRHRTHSKQGQERSMMTPLQAHM